MKDVIVWSPKAREHFHIYAPLHSFIKKNQKNKKKQNRTKKKQNIKLALHSMRTNPFSLPADAVSDDRVKSEYHTTGFFLSGVRNGDRARPRQLALDG